MAKKEHIGFQLHDDRPIDKRVIDILNSLPERENKCAFIRKAIIFYDDHKDDFENTPSGDKLNDEKLDLILKKLDELKGVTEIQTEREEESHLSQPAPEPVSSQPSLPAPEPVSSQPSLPAPEPEPSVETEPETEAEPEVEVVEPEIEAKPEVEVVEPEIVPAEKPEKKAKKEEKKEKKDDKNHLDVSSEIENINVEAYNNALGDFLG